MRIPLFFLLGVIIFGACQADKKSKHSDNSTSGNNEFLFTEKKFKHTGIKFKNVITQDPIHNILAWEYMFNGGGVAVGDINNDNLPDIFFCGNQVPNRLYLNKGNLKFEDITDVAKINVKSKDNKTSWHTGVTMADINNDGFLDIYVCRSGMSKVTTIPENLLFINNGDNTFTEQAKDFGINDPGFSVTSSFFDYDKDGDLDLIVNNHFAMFNNRKKRGEVEQYLKENPEVLKKYSSHLYRNDNGKFKDITGESGMLKYDYSLGLVTTDLNNDGYTDIYVSNDYTQPNIMWINDKKGGFKDLIKDNLNHVAYFSMGADVNDFNNDGFPEIIAVDMASKDHVTSKTAMASMQPEQFNIMTQKYGQIPQYMFNEFQLNNANGSFSEISNMAGIAKTEWSWAPLFADFDNDGFKDLFITNGYKQNSLDNDFKIKFRERKKQGNIPMNERMEWLRKIPEFKAKNCFYKNKGDLTFQDNSDTWFKNRKTVSSGAAYSDLDNDGDLDLVINNIDEFASILENNSSNKNYIQIALKTKNKNFTSLYNAKVYAYSGEQVFYQEMTPSRGFQSSVDPLIHFGLGNNSTIDKIVVVWNNGMQQIIDNPKINQRLKVYVEDANEKYNSTKSNASILAKNTLKSQYTNEDFNDFEKEILLPHKLSTMGAPLTVGMINKDKLEDYFTGGGLGQTATIHIQQSNGTFKTESNKALEKDKKYKDLGALFFDADGDGDEDLYVCSGGAGEIEKQPNLLQDRLYINNNGKLQKSNLITIKSSTKAIVSIDFDSDGDLDLFVGGRNVPGQYPRAPKSYLLENDGKGNFTDVIAENATSLEFKGMITDALVTDYNNDGKQDLVICGEWLPVCFFTNIDGKLVDETEKYGDPKKTGWWFSLAENDINQDGKKDIIAGNIGANNKFHPKASKPLKILFNDFDNNGTEDIYLTTKYKGEEVPVRGRECSSQQMPFIKEKFTNYNSFANANITEILGEEKVKNAIEYQAIEFKHCIFQNENGAFKNVIHLPNHSQVSPLRDIIFADINGDGVDDLLGVGNLKDSEVETTAYDAGIGYCALNIDRKLKSIPVAKSGFYADSETRAIVPIQLANGKKRFIVSKSNGQYDSFEIK